MRGGVWGKIKSQEGLVPGFAIIGNSCQFGPEKAGNRTHYPLRILDPDRYFFEG
jgi:hypothetical protein